MNIQEYNENECKNLLIKYFNELKIELKYIEPVFKFLIFLMKKNEELNLVSRKLDLNIIITDHIYDCLSVWEFFKNYDSITDLGTGGGFPGILLAIIFQSKKFVFIEKSPKKVQFLKEAIKTLNLNNIIIKSSLVSEQKIETKVVTCRGFKSIIEILQMTKSYFYQNGLYILYKGRFDKINEELSEAKKKFNFEQSIIKISCIVDKERHIVKIQSKS